MYFQRIKVISVKSVEEKWWSEVIRNNAVILIQVESEHLATKGTYPNKLMVVELRLPKPVEN